MYLSSKYTVIIQRSKNYLLQNASQMQVKAFSFCINVKEKYRQRQYKLSGTNYTMRIERGKGTDFVVNRQPVTYHLPPRYLHQ